MWMKSRRRGLCGAHNLARFISTFAIVGSLVAVGWVTLHPSSYVEARGEAVPVLAIKRLFGSRSPASQWQQRAACPAEHHISGQAFGNVAWATLAADLCNMERAADDNKTPPANPVVMVRDTSRERYFAKRDLQAWQVAYERLDMQVEELGLAEATQLSQFTVLICLGLAFTDKLCVQAEDQLQLKNWQRINQFYGMRWLLWRKDGFCDTLTSALLGSNVKPDFFFRCWKLPQEMPQFLAVASGKEYPSDQAWIVKPTGRGEGNGIFITDSTKSLSSMKLDGHIVQPFLERPLLIEKKKWDLRTYVLVTSTTPLRAYFYSEGLVRFAALPYNATACRQGAGHENRCLTNTSINKKFAHISQLTWTYQKLKRHLEENGMSSRTIFRAVRRAIAKSLLSAEFGFRSKYHEVEPGYRCASCFQLLGIDVILDEQFNPFVIEINGLPSMQLSHEFGVPIDRTADYTQTKLGLTHDMLEILFRPPSIAAGVAQSLSALNMHEVNGKWCHASAADTATRAKHNYCLDKRDLDELIQIQRENAARGRFVRLYPSSDNDQFDDLVLHSHNRIRGEFGQHVQTNWKLHWVTTQLAKMAANNSPEE